MGELWVIWQHTGIISVYTVVDMTNPWLKLERGASSVVEAKRQRVGADNKKRGGSERENGRERTYEKLKKTENTRER